MNERPLLGTCACPLCHRDGAEVRLGNTGTAFLRCSQCTARLRVSSRNGDRLLRLRMYASPGVAMKV